MQVCSPHNTKLMSLKCTEFCRATCIHVSVTGQNLIQVINVLT